MNLYNTLYNFALTLQYQKYSKIDIRLIFSQNLLQQYDIQRYKKYKKYQAF